MNDVAHCSVVIYIYLGLLEGSLKDLLKLMLIPSYFRLQPSKFPHPINLHVVVLVCGVAVTSQLHRLQVRGSIHLMGGSQLMMANDLRVGEFLPARGAEEVLRLYAGVAEEIVACNHGHEFVSWHGIPSPLADGSVVHEKSWCDDATETGPILFIYLEDCLSDRNLVRCNRFQFEGLTFAS